LLSSAKRGSRNSSGPVHRLKYEHVVHHAQRAEMFPLPHRHFAYAHLALVFKGVGHQSIRLNCGFFRCIVSGRFGHRLCKDAYLELAMVTAGLYPDIEPYDRGMLGVGAAEFIYWETCGNVHGKPAVVLHGGPGSGCVAWHRRLFDPTKYRMVLFDQRGCGRSKPHASAPNVDMSTNNTANLIDDIEALRRHLGIEQWLVWGGSWGSTLALAYAESHSARVTEMILWGVTTGRRSEFDWLFRGGVAAFFPEQWERLLAALPVGDRNRDIVESYRRLLTNPDPAVHQQAAHSWCLWESAAADWPPTNELTARFRDPHFAVAFARIVTHYVAHNAWIEDESLIRGAAALADIPGVLINGRFDFQAPIGNALALHRVWPSADLIIVDDTGHAPDAPDLTNELIRASDRFALRS
jgi:proline iminopeptidase